MGPMDPCKVPSGSRSMEIAVLLGWWWGEIESRETQGVGLSHWAPDA